MSRVGKIVGGRAQNESDEFLAVITIGEETAGILRSRGYDVQAGDEIDLGRVAYRHKNPFKSWLGRRKVSKGFDPATVKL